MRRLALWMLVVTPGVAAIFVCGYYLFLDWAALNVAFARFERLSAEGADLRALTVAQTMDQVFRINCFADGVGVMLGAILAAIGVHGLCLLPATEGNSKLSAASTLAGVVAVVAGLGFCAYLIARVGTTNALRQAIARGDAASVRSQIRGGTDVNDQFWWGQRPLTLAQRAAAGADRDRIIRLLKDAGARE
jgi:hypothetical protein